MMIFPSLFFYLGFLFFYYSFIISIMFNRDVGTLQDVVDYFNQHPFLFEREDFDRGHMERVMAVLTQENMELLEKQFQLYSRGLELPTFIYLIKRLYRPDHELSKYFFVSDLIKFFQAIDINGDGHLEWSQFTQYIIENIRVVQKPRYKNKAFEQNQIISSAYSKVSNEYRINKVHDLNCSTAIKKVIYFEEMQNYYLIQSQASCIRIFDRKFSQIDQIQLEFENIRSSIVDFGIDKENSILSCIFQDFLYFANLKIRNPGVSANKESSMSYKRFGKVEYLPLHKFWVLCGKTGQMLFFSVTYVSRTTFTFQAIKTLNHHDSLITEVVQVEEPKSIATSSMDGCIKLYSNYLDKYYHFQYISEQTPSIINENRKKGILGISYSGQFGNYMISFGFSTSVYVYSLDISITKGYVGKYTQHTGSILYAKFIKSYPYVLSFDDKMNMRIWDFRKFQTVQFLNCEKIFISPSRLQIIPELFEVLICQKKITQFRAPALEKKSKEINEFHNIFDFKFCPITNQIFVFTSNDVRIYNYYTGSLKKLFTKLYEQNCETNITACEFGFKCRRFFVGDAGGFVREFCSQTGEQLQRIDPGDELHFQNKQIVKIIFMKQHSILICISADGRIMIYQRGQQGEYVIIRDIRDCHDWFVCGAVSERYCMLATAGDDGGIVLWNLEKYIMDGMCVVNSKPVGIVFSPIHPILIVATQDGFINFFYVKPHEGKDRYKCFAKVSINESNISEWKISSFSCELIINAYFPKQCKLNKCKGNYHLIAGIGTSNGNIVIVNFNKILEIYKVEENHQISMMKNTHRCQVQVMKSIITNEKNRILLSGFSNNVKNVHDLAEFIHEQIKGPEGVIENILVSKQCSAIFCKSIDKKLRVYSFKSEYNGAINFSTFKKIFWKIPEINFFKKIQAIDTTIYSIKLIENKKFSNQQENRVKAHLLLNEYLNNREKEKYCNWLEEKYNKPEEKRLVKSKMKKPPVQNALSEQEFNQIYTKLKNSIEKSLQQYNQSDKLIWERLRCKSKKHLTHLNQATDICSNEDFLIEKENSKIRPKDRKNTVKDESKKKKFDPNFQLFGKKTEIPKKEAEQKRKNMLFTPLSTAKKLILSNISTSHLR